MPVEAKVVFCQLPGSVRGGEPATFATESLEIAMGAHNKRLIFIMAPGMEWPMVLRLTWLK